MAAAAPKSFEYEIDVEDVEYLRLGDRLQDTTINEQLARSGILVAALDFRLPPVASYPGSLADINYGIRWLKTKADSLGTRPDMVCTFGISSGGHQAMLLGMRPREPRYSAIPVAGDAAAIDASVRAVIMGAPVIDPIGRYR